MSIDFHRCNKRGRGLIDGMEQMKTLFSNCFNNDVVDENQRKTADDFIAN